MTKPYKIEKTSRNGLGNAMLAAGVISDDQLLVALCEQKHSGKMLGEQLLSLGFITAQQLQKFLSAAGELASVDLDLENIDDNASALLSKEEMQSWQCLPFKLDKKTGNLIVAITPEVSLPQRDNISQILPAGYRIEFRKCSAAMLQNAFTRRFGKTQYRQSLRHRMFLALQSKVQDNTQQKSVSDEEDLLELLLTDALAEHASDIHFAPRASHIDVQLRIDGLLQQRLSIHQTLWSALLVRLKVMAHMDIAETRKPQDGRFSRSIQSQQIEFRCASHPSRHGEIFVMRLLNKNRLALSLNALGLADNQLSILQTQLHRPHGLILLTGPTGSGKTTSLYAMLAEFDHKALNIMTLEDPVEYPMPDIRQTDLSECRKIDYADGIRSILRQDPDVILIGEIRDPEIARMTIRAAMTGHLVLSTLHCNNAIDAIHRLTEMGIDASLLASNLVAVIGQRLLRKLCQHCRTPLAHDNPLYKQRLGGQQYQAAACCQCDFRGYSGRFAICEILPTNEVLISFVLARNVREIDRHLAKHSFSNMQQQAVQAISNGLTSAAEVLRVLGPYGVHGEEL